MANCHNSHMRLTATFPHQAGHVPIRQRQLEALEKGFPTLYPRPLALKYSPLGAYIRRRFAASSLATIRTRSPGRTTLQRSELTCLALPLPATTISAVGSDRFDFSG